MPPPGRPLKTTTQNLIANKMLIRKDHNELRTGDNIYATVKYEIIPMRAIKQAFVVHVLSVATDEEIEIVLRETISMPIIVRKITRPLGPTIVRSE